MKAGVIDHRTVSMDDKMLRGGASSIDSDKFDLEAKVDTAVLPKLAKVAFHERAAMLQPLLAERFGLRTHFESKTFPVDNLLISKAGMKLMPSRHQGNDGKDNAIMCNVVESYRGFVKMRDCTIASLNDLLRYATGRTIIDRTGLTGHYDFELRWKPVDLSSSSTEEDSAPIIFTALQEQLGLKLEPASAPLNILVVDHADKPTAN